MGQPHSQSLIDRIQACKNRSLLVVSHVGTTPSDGAVTLLLHSTPSTNHGEAPWRPSAIWQKKSTLSGPAKATVQVIGVAPYEWFASWRDTSWQRRGPDYEAFKQRLSDRLLRKFLEVAPQARDHIEYSELSTPLSTRHFSNHPYGEIYGLEHTPERFRLPWLRTRTPVRNLLLTGQDVVVVGVTSAAMSGVLAASVVLRRNLLSRITR